MDKIVNEWKLDITGVLSGDQIDLCIQNIVTGEIRHRLILTPNKWAEMCLLLESRDGDK